MHHSALSLTHQLVKVNEVVDLWQQNVVELVRHLQRRLSRRVAP